MKHSTRKRGKHKGQPLGAQKGFLLVGEHFGYKIKKLTTYSRDDDLGFL
jgi:hypothetical protein